jgi:tetratricopeptide (TPR) repeat protein
MGSSNRCTLTTITVFHIAFSFSFLPVQSADAIPTAEDINSLAEKAHQTTDTFIQKSFQLRMAYEYSGKFLISRDKEQLNTLAKMAGDQLLAIEASQRKIKQQIEDYQGDDWDDRYGSTGLWRKLSADLYITAEYKGQIDFYLALTARQPQRNKILHKILAQIDVSDATYHSAKLQLLRARIYSLLSRTDSSYKPLATQKFDLLMARSDMRHSTTFRIAIERMILFGPTVPEKLNTLAENIAKSRCKDDIELVLSLAFLQRRYEPESLKKTVQIWPQIEDILGSLALSDLSNRIKEGQLTKQYLQQISVFEADLAARGAWKNKTKACKTLLGRLSGIEKFHTPLMLYVTAIASADSLPAEAVNLLIKASTLQQLQKSDRLKIEADEIAKQAAQLAYGFYNHNPADCRLAAEAFGNYHTMAAEKIDEQLEYLYTTILNNCGEIGKSKILLEKIANRPTGHWRNRAKLDLITTAIRQHQSENPEKIRVILKQLDTLIKELRLSNKDNELRTEAIKIHCRLIFQSKQIASAWKVLDVLTDSDIAVDPNLNILKANTLRQLGRLEESADCLLKAIGLDHADYVIEAMALLSEIINKIDQLQEQSNDFPKLVGNCEKIARYCERISLSTFGLVPVSKARLYLAEISVLAALNKQEKLLAIKKLLDDLPSNDKNDNANFTRCRARLLTTQGKFAEAAHLWAHLAKIHTNETHKANQRRWKWWRAKFYELYCCAQIPQTEKQGVLHTIEVLESSFTNIPPLWAGKLNLLKQKCRYPEK